MNTKRRVSSETYDREYFLSSNTEGYEEYKSGSLSYVKQIQIDMLELSPGITLLEIGVGRGEFLYHCAKAGAQVSGIDYSNASLDISKGTLREYPDADLRWADCKDLPFEPNSFDRVYSGDVLEHQDIDDGAVMLREMYRVLRPGGSMLVHTAPNSVFMKLVYPIVKPVLRRIDASTINALEQHLVVNREVHVLEYNLFSLRKVARMANLANAEIWIGADIVRSSRHRHTQALSESRLVQTVARLGKYAVVRFFFGNDLFLRVRKPS